MRSQILYNFFLSRVKDAVIQFKTYPYQATSFLLAIELIFKTDRFIKNIRN